MCWLQADLPLLEADFLATVLHDLEFSEEASLQSLCIDNADWLLFPFDTATLSYAKSQKSINFLHGVCWR
jgi:hypothetical protein